jgi:hypothetical protein
MKTEGEIKTIIESTIQKDVRLVKASDCCMLLYEADVNGIVVARIYKSFDIHFNPITQIRYTEAELTNN